MNIGNQIRRLRKQKGITQKDLADSIGVTQPYLSQIESGKGTTTETMQKICKRIGAEIRLEIPQAEHIEILKQLGYQVVDELIAKIEKGHAISEQFEGVLFPSHDHSVCLCWPQSAQISFVKPHWHMLIPPPRQSAPQPCRCRCF